MSLWPIIFVECLTCDAHMFAHDYDLDADDDQQKFLDALIRDGWGSVPVNAKDFEASDEGGLIAYCPKCKVDGSGETEG